MSVLITAANSAQAYRLKSLLSADEQPILLGDYQDIPELMVNNGTMLKTPNPASPSFAHEMLTLCLDKGINTIFPLRRDEIVPLAESRQLFLEFDIILIIPKTDMIAGHFAAVKGDTVILNRSEVIAGNREAAIPEGLTDGVFTIGNNGAYQIVTAD